MSIPLRWAERLRSQDTGGRDMRRREFFGVLGGGVAFWPLIAAAQQSARPRRIGILHDYQKDDAEGRMQLDAFHDELKKLGWIEGQNVIFDFQAEDCEDRTRRSNAHAVVA